MIHLNYEYSGKILANGRKYPAFTDGAIDAIYTEADLNCDKGNPMIECLPEPPSNEEIRDFYFTPFKEECNLNKPAYKQILDAQRLKDMRVPLPFYPRMELQFYNALISSARQRFRDFRNRPFTVIMNDQEVIQAASYKTSIGGDTGIGVTLLGIGGCGKSEAISNMISRYPQLIHHDISGVGEFHQIVWLNVVTPSNSNLSNLYIAFGDALDEALGNQCSVYATRIRNLPNVGAKARYVSQLIRNFNICALILDEIQNLDSGKNRESSYNSLMEIINTTKIALVIVGTEEAYSMLCRKYYLARRTGSIIDASRYCYDQDAFNKRMQFIMKYNWFRDDVKMAPIDELLKELYRETHGVIDRMISLWIEIQIAYISAKSSEKPAITSEFIRFVSNNSNPLMAAYTEQTLNNSPLLPEVVTEEQVIVETSSEDLILARKQAADNLIMDVLNTVDNPKKAERVFQLVKSSLNVMRTPYVDSTILEKVASVMKRKANGDCTEEELAQKTVDSLKRLKSDARPKASIGLADRENFVEQFID